MQNVYPQKYIKNFTGIRALFSIWIVLFHFSAAPLVRIPSLAPFFDRGHVATDFFLILSGFVISYIYFDKMPELRPFAYAQFLLKRLARLYPLHILTFLVIVLFYWGVILSGHDVANPSQFSLSSALLNVFMLHAWVPEAPLGWNFVSWSISAEWFAYLCLFPFILTGWRRLSQFMRALLVLTVYLLYVSHGADAYLPERLLRMSFAFLFGTWLYHFLPSLKAVSQTFWRIAFILIPMLVCAIVMKSEYNDLHPLVSPLWGAFILVLYHEKHLSHVILANPLAMRLGTISFSTYLVHGVLAKFLFHLQVSTLPALGWLHQLSPGVLLPIALIGTLATSDLVHRIYEGPARDWMIRHGSRWLSSSKTRAEFYGRNIRGFLS